MASNSGKKSGECCYPRCKCPYAMKKHKLRLRKKKAMPGNREKKRLRPYKFSPWVNAMALRPPGYLLANKMAFKGVFPERIQKLMNKYLEQSLQTEYSKRSRFVQENFLQPIVKPRRMGKKDWERHREWVKTKALPKKYTIEKVKRGPRVPLGKLKRTERLSKPRYRRKKYKARKPKSTVKKAALHYKLSKRTRRLTKALERFHTNKFNYDYSPKSTVSPNALIAICSRRTRGLAVPKQLPNEPTRKETKYGIALEALKYTVSERIESLAKAKVAFVGPDEEDELIVIEDRELSAYGVSVNAMKYKASKKILEMAKPKEPPMEAEPDYPYEERILTKYNVVANALKYKISDRILKMSVPRTNDE